MEAEATATPAWTNRHRQEAVRCYGRVLQRYAGSLNLERAETAGVSLVLSASNLASEDAFRAWLSALAADLESDASPLDIETELQLVRGLAEDRVIQDARVFYRRPWTKEHGFECMARMHELSAEAVRSGRPALGWATAGHEGDLRWWLAKVARFSGKRIEAEVNIIFERAEKRLREQAEKAAAPDGGGT